MSRYETCDRLLSCPGLCLTGCLEGVEDKFPMSLRWMRAEHRDSGGHARLFIPSQPQKLIAVVLGLPGQPQKPFMKRN